jgi:hypothetical protein
MGIEWNKSSMTIRETLQSAGADLASIVSLYDTHRKLAVDKAGFDADIRMRVGDLAEKLTAASVGKDGE